MEGITALSVSENGEYIAVGCQDGWYYIFDTWGNRVGSGYITDAVVSLDIADTGKLLVGSAGEYTFCTREGTQGSGYLSYPVRTVSISSDGALSLVCAQRNFYVNYNDSMAYQLEVSEGFPFGAVNSDGSMACAAAGESLHVFKNGTFQNPYAIGKEVEYLFVSKDGKKVTFSTNKGVGYLDVEEGTIDFKEIGAFITTVTASSGDTTLVSIYDRLLWLKNGFITNELPITDICCLSLSDDGSLAVVGKEDGTLQVITLGGILLAEYTFGSCPVALEMSQEHLVVCTDTGVYAVQFFEKTKSNTHFYAISSRKALPLTSSLEEVWSVPAQVGAAFFVADVDGDGQTEVALKEGTTITLVNEDGILEARKDIGAPFSRFIPLDSDGDTLPEIFIEFEPYFEFSAYDWIKETMTEYYFDTFRDMATQGTVIPFASLDSDNDGEREILASVSTGYACSPRGIVSIDSESGDVEWFYQMGPGVLPRIIEDIDGDGGIDIVLGSVAPCNCGDDEQFPDCETFVTALSGTGEVLWKVSVGPGYRRVDVCADDIHDGEGVEIVGFGYEASENWGKLFVLNCHGEYLYGFEVDYSVYPGAVADIDGDGRKEVVTLDSRGYLSVFTFDLQKKLEIFIDENLNKRSQIYFNDINGDGDCEILLAAEKELFIFDNRLNSVWEKKFEDEIHVLITHFFGCKNTVLVLSDRLYAFSYKDVEGPCPLWEITERTLQEEGTSHLGAAESFFAAGEYRDSKTYFERALTVFSQLEDEEMIDSISEKIRGVSHIIFRQNVKTGVILLAVCDSFLCAFIVYSWITRKRWSRLVEGTLLLSLPVFLGLFQVYYTDSQEYVKVFARYFVPFFILSVAVFVRQNILGFARTIMAWRGGHKDMLVLSIGRADGSYRVSVESIEEKFRPIKESREIAFTEKTRKDLTKEVEYMMKVLKRVPSQNGPSDSGSSFEFAEELLRKTGRVIYEKTIPEDFSEILKAKFLLLEMEDTEIPWELMYADDFLALKYAVSRRIVTTESVNIRPSGKRGRRALIISDPREDLQGASLECDIIYKRLSQKMDTVLVKGSNANVQKIANLFGQGFDIIHYAGHVDNELVLSDGVLTPEEVKEFIVGTPVVFVNGCKSEELAKAFLLGGAMAYVGTIHPVHDVSAAEIAADFYDLCMQYQIGEALRRARLSHIDKDLVWASLIMYGDPTLKML